MENVISQGILFGSGLCFLFAAVHLAQPEPVLSDRVITLLAASAGVVLFYAYLLSADIILDWAPANHMYVPFIYFLGPGLYVLFLSTIYESGELKSCRFLFVPGALLLVGLPALGLLRPDFFERAPVEYFRGVEVTALDAVVVAGWFLNTGYYLLLLRRCAAIFTLASLRAERPARILLGILLGTVTITSYLISAYFMRDMDGLLFSAFLTTVLAVVSHIAVQGAPDLFSELGPAIQKADRISRLSGLNLNSLQARLVRLMEEERLYQEDDLTLARLSEELDVRPYQLSEYLNSYLDQNFSRFVNGYRVAAAARMLLEETDASVLSVAFRVGFNSKANFNLAFKSILGMAPRDYVRRERRKRHIGAPSSRAVGATVRGRQKP